MNLNLPLMFWTFIALIAICAFGAGALGAMR
jgi:hypothetical protein